jgi:hypothetical protein
MAAVDNQDALTQLVALVEEQLRWHKAAAMPQVRATIEAALTTTQLRRAYELCDGKRTFDQIAKEVGASQGSISNWTRRWRDMGIAFDRPDGRVQHLTTLAALGIPLEVSE